MSDGRTRGWEDSSRGCQGGHDDQTFFCHKWLVSHCNVDGDGNDTVSDNEGLKGLSEQDRPERGGHHIGELWLWGLFTGIHISSLDVGHAGCSSAADRYPSITWTSEVFLFNVVDACSHRLGLSLYCFLKEFEVAVPAADCLFGLRQGILLKNGRPEFVSHICRKCFFPVESYQWLKYWRSSGNPARHMAL